MNRAPLLILGFIGMFSRLSLLVTFHFSALIGIRIIIIYIRGVLVVTSYFLVLNKSFRLVKIIKYKIFLVLIFSSIFCSIVKKISPSFSLNLKGDFNSVSSGFLDFQNLYLLGFITFFLLILILISTRLLRISGKRLRPWK